MYELNLALNNKELYEGCRVCEIKPGRFRLVTPIEEALVSIAANMSKILRAIPREKRDTLVITGAAPQQVLMTALTVMAPHFQQLEHFDGKQKLTTQIPKN